MDMYTLAWAGYLLGAFTFCGFIWWQTIKLPFAPIRNCLRIWPAIIFFVPAYIVEGQPELAPAFVVVIFKTLQQGWDAATGDAAPIVAALSISTAVIISVSIVNWVRRPKAAATPETAKEEG